jgi:hypothetical protein
MIDDDEMERIWKEVAMAYSRYNTIPENLKTKNLIQDRQSPCRVITFRVSGFIIIYNYKVEISIRY